MSEPSRSSRRQVARTARLMLVDPSAVQGLDGVPAADLQVLHDQISESYFAPGRELLARVAGLAKVLPATVTGKLAERFLPPTQGARSAEMLEPAKARDLCDKVSVRYLADLSLALDPSRARSILQAIPPDRVAAVTAELFDRREYGAVAELAGSVSRDALAAAIGVADGKDLLTLLPLLDWSDDLVVVLDWLSAAKVDGLLAALVDDELWAQGADLLAEVPAPTRAKLSAGAGRLSSARRTRLASAVAAGDLGQNGESLLDGFDQ